MNTYEIMKIVIILALVFTAWMTVTFDELTLVNMTVTVNDLYGVQSLCTADRRVYDTM